MQRDPRSRFSFSFSFELKKGQRTIQQRELPSRRSSCRYLPLVFLPL